MKTIKQAVRQPMRTVAGLLLIAMAVSILIACAGQYAAAELTRREMDRQYSTVALPTDAYQNLSRNQRKEWWKWYDNLIENQSVGDRTYLIKSISHTGLLSAYIPEMEVDNYTRYNEWSKNYHGEELGVPYNCAVFVITLDEISPEIKEEKLSGTSNGINFEIDKYASVECKGMIEEVVALQDGFNSPQGWSINLTVRAANKAAIEDMELKIGQRYLVYGMDYHDNDWEIRMAVSETEAQFAKPFDMALVYKDHPLGSDYETTLGDPTREVYYYKNIVKGKEYYAPFFAESLAMVQNCSLTVCDYATLNHIVTKYDENGYMVGFEGLTDQCVLLDNEHSDLRTQYGSSLISKEQFVQMYSVPAMIELETSLDAFLNSTDGTAWQRALESMEINNHAFPVLAVDKLNYQAEFVREQARIVQGRDFTESELVNGEKVCILSESQAVANGLSVGDTITMQTYYYDPNIMVHVHISFYPNPASPYPSYYSQARGFSSEPESYTIVGLYRLSNERGGTNSYGFTSSTIFIPKSSATGTMVTWDEGVFRSIVLHNGTMDDFLAVLEEYGYEEMFVVYDQGYSDIFSGLNAYEAVAGKAIYVGLGAYAALLLLYLLLFPGRQKKTLATMGSLGAPRGRKFMFLLTFSLTTLIPGTVLGAAASVILRDYVTAELMDAVGVSIPLVFGGTAMTLAVAAVQLVAATVAVALCGLLLARNSNMTQKGR